MTRVIERNFFRLVRAGAFNDNEAIEPMSRFKWRRLFEMVEKQNVLPEFVKGAARHGLESYVAIPAELTEMAQQQLAARKPAPRTDVRNFPEMNNRFLDRRLRKLIDNEHHSIDTSVESLELLRIIVENSCNMLSNGISLHGIIRLGQYLRNKGDKVDFVKLDNWLEVLHLVRMAQLQGSVLIAVFGFEKDEVPFVHKEEKDAYAMAVRSITNLANDTAEEALEKGSDGEYRSNTSRKLRRNLSRSMRYYGFAPIETASSFLGKIGKSLKEMDE